MNTWDAMNINMQRSSYRERDSKESEDIHIPGIDVGGGWRTGCGSHHRVQSGWKNWKGVPGVLCNR